MLVLFFFEEICAFLRICLLILITLCLLLSYSCTFLTISIRLHSEQGVDLIRVCSLNILELNKTQIFIEWLNERMSRKVRFLA